jgi:putative oxidoreductase
MKKILSTSYSETVFNTGTFILRASLGLLMCINHGFGKVTNFNELSQTFFDPFHIGHRWSLMLSIFAELFCSMLLVLGLFSRIAAFILVINMAVAVFMVNRHFPLKQSEESILFFAGFLMLLLVGPGKYSVDGMSGK